MIKIVIDWAKTHKLTTLLLLIVGLFIFKSTFGFSSMMGMKTFSSSDSYDSGGFMGRATTMEYGATSVESIPSNSDYSQKASPLAPNTSVKASQRMVTKNYSLSAVSKDVKESSSKIATEIDRLGGYVVSNSLNEYQGVSTANMSARVPAENAKAFVETVRKYSAKIVTENVSASDITDEYTDVTEHLRLLEGTKVRFEEVWRASTKTQDMLQVLREIQSIQQEIDRLKGQQKYYEETSKLSYFNIYLSKDEMDLPYMPSESWSAEYVFKAAVRELITVTRGLASRLIWLAVFSVIWVPVCLVAFLVIRRFRKQIIG